MGTYYVNAVLEGLANVDPYVGRTDLKKEKFSHMDIAFLAVIANRQPNPSPTRPNPFCYGDAGTLSGMMHIGESSFFKMRNKLVALDLISFTPREGRNTNVYRIRLDTIRRLRPDLTNDVWQNAILRTRSAYLSDEEKETLCITTGNVQYGEPLPADNYDDNSLMNKANWDEALYFIARACNTTVDKLDKVELQRKLKSKNLTREEFRLYITNFYRAAHEKKWLETKSPSECVALFVASLNQPVPTSACTFEPTTCKTPGRPKTASDWPDIVGLLNLGKLPAEKLDRLAERCERHIPGDDPKRLEVFYKAFFKQYLQSKYEHGNDFHNARELIKMCTTDDHRYDLIMKEFDRAEAGLRASADM